MREFFKYIYILLFILCSQVIFSQAEYYGEKLNLFHSMTASELRSHLQKILSSHHLPQKGLPDLIGGQYKKSPGSFRHKAMSYKDKARALSFELHSYRQKNRFITEKIYCNSLFYSPSVKQLKNQAKKNYTNIEHIWPRHRFNIEKAGHFKVSDLHHLAPAPMNVNNARGNYPFAEVTPDTNQDISFYKLVKINKTLGGNQLGLPNHPNQNGRLYFEPRDEDKGRIARSLMYFSVRYNLPISEIELYFILKWHQQFPVSENERLRNDKIFKLQFNRNPFIDYPELAERVFILK